MFFERAIQPVLRHWTAIFTHHSTEEVEDNGSRAPFPRFRYYQFHLIPSPLMDLL